MAERTVGIRELKAKLSEYVHAVKEGATIIVTEHGRPVARLVPETPSMQKRLEALTEAGAIRWSGRRLGRTRPQARSRGKRTVADLLVENRG